MLILPFPKLFSILVILVRYALIKSKYNLSYNNNIYIEIVLPERSCEVKIEKPPGGSHLAHLETEPVLSHHGLAESSQSEPGLRLLNYHIFFLSLLYILQA